MIYLETHVSIENKLVSYDPVEQNEYDVRCDEWILKLLKQDVNSPVRVSVSSQIQFTILLFSYSWHEPRVIRHWLCHSNFCNSPLSHYRHHLRVCKSIRFLSDCVPKRKARFIPVLHAQLPGECSVLSCTHFVIQLACSLVDLHISFVMQPIPLFPIRAGHCAGFFSTVFHFTSHTLMTALLLLVGFQVNALNVCFLRKHQGIGRVGNTKLSESAHNALFLLFLTYPFFFTSAFFYSKIEKEDQFRIISQVSIYQHCRMTQRVTRSIRCSTRSLCRSQSSPSTQWTLPCSSSSFSPSEDVFKPSPQFLFSFSECTVHFWSSKTICQKQHSRSTKVHWKA